MNPSLEGERTLLSIYIPEDQDVHGTPLVDRLLEKLRSAGIRGATVIPVWAGFGDGNTFRGLQTHVSADHPLLIQIIEDSARVPAVLAAIKPLLPIGMIFSQPVQVLMHNPSRLF